MRSFICRGCSNPVISTGHTSVDIGASANLEVVDKFCYLGDMLSADKDAAVEARIRNGWNKFRQSVPLQSTKFDFCCHGGLCGRTHPTAVNCTQCGPIVCAVVWSCNIRILHI